MSCVFCKIVKGEIPGERVYEDENCFAIKDIHPQAPTHLLFFPKDHVESLVEIKDPGLMGHLFAAVLKVAREGGLDKKGFRTIINTGKGAGQTVFHMHIHVMSGRAMSENMG